MRRSNDTNGGGVLAVYCEYCGQVFDRGADTYPRVTREQHYAACEKRRRQKFSNQARSRVREKYLATGRGPWE